MGGGPVATVVVRWGAETSIAPLIEARREQRAGEVEPHAKQKKLDQGLFEKTCQQDSSLYQRSLIMTHLTAFLCLLARRGQWTPVGSGASPPVLFRPPMTAKGTGGP